MATDDMFAFVNDSFDKYVSGGEKTCSSASVSDGGHSTKLVFDSKATVDPSISAPTTASTTDDTNVFWDDEKRGDAVGKMLALVNCAISKLQSSVDESGRVIKESRRVVKECEAEVRPKKTPALQSTPGTPGGNSHSHLQKTALCKHFQDDGNCPFGKGCWLAHGLVELRPVTGLSLSRAGSLVGTPSFNKSSVGPVRPWSSSVNWRP